MPSELDDMKRQLDAIKWYNRWTQRITAANLTILIIVLLVLLTRLFG
jgi:succinate dehydrogenase hydrophobic anchor subunit